MRSMRRRSWGMRWPASLLLASIVALAVPAGPPAARAGTPTPGSARARLKSTSTLDGLHLFLYQTSGRLGTHYTPAQLATVGALYDLVTWVYAGSGVPGALRQGNPNVIVTQYNDLTWVGDWNIKTGVPWMPMDWDWVNSHESFFSHSAAARPWSEKSRIPNPFFGWGSGSSIIGWDPDDKPDPRLGTPHEWQANPFDIDTADPTNLHRWVNYFADRTRALIEQDSMDGVMVDEAMQPYSLPPDGFEPEAWHAAVKRALAFLRERVGEGAVMFWNGILQDALLFPQDLAAAGGWARPRSLDYLESADGALIECYVTCYLDPFPDVWPQPVWEEIQDLGMEIDRRGGVLLALSPSAGDGTRLFSLASFYLLKGDHSYYGRRMEWLPEYEVEMGRPLATGVHVADYLVAPGRDLGVAGARGVVYARPYEAGVVLVNPSAEDARVDLGRQGFVVRPTGGGGIGASGVRPAGSITYEPTTSVDLPPQSGALVVWRVPD